MNSRSDFQSDVQITKDVIYTENSEEVSHFENKKKKNENHQDIEKEKEILKSEGEKFENMNSLEQLSELSDFSNIRVDYDLFSRVSSSVSSKKPKCRYFMVHMGEDDFHVIYKCDLWRLLKVIAPDELCVITDHILFPYPQVYHIVPEEEEIMNAVSCSHKYEQLKQQKDSRTSRVLLSDFYRIMYSTVLNAMYIDTDTFLLEKLEQDRLLVQDKRDFHIHNNMFNISNTLFLKYLEKDICAHLAFGQWGPIGPPYFTRKFEMIKNDYQKQISNNKKNDDDGGGRGRGIWNSISNSLNSGEKRKTRERSIQAYEELTIWESHYTFCHWLFYHTFYPIKEKSWNEVQKCSAMHWGGGKVFRGANKWDKEYEGSYVGEFFKLGGIYHYKDCEYLQTYSLDQYEDITHSLGSKKR